MRSVVDRNVDMRRITVIKNIGRGGSPLNGLSVAINAISSIISY
jgi:hypothetical protein